MSRVRAMVASVLAMTAVATAQRQPRPLLDLSGGPQPPAAGSGAGALALAEELIFQADAMARSADPHDKAKAAVRRLTAKLLQTGERAGAPGSVRVIIGRTLSDGLPGIDAAIVARDGAGSEATLKIIEADALAAARTLDAPGADPWRTVRDGLAALADLTPEVVPAEPDHPFADRIDAWSKLPGVRADLGVALRSLDETLAAAAHWNAYRPGAAHRRRLIAEAGDALGTLPAWVPEATRQHLGEEFTRAIDGALKREDQPLVEGRLERIARLARLAARTDALDTSPAGQKVRAAIAQVMTATAPDPAAERRGLEAYQRALDLTLSRHTADEDKRLVRALRPAWRTLATAEKQTEASLYAALPELARRPEAMTEPGILATLNAAQRSADDLAGVQDLSALLSDGTPDGTHEPEVKPQWTRLAARVLKLSQDLAKPASRDTSLAALRAIIEQSRSYAAIADEQNLTDPAWDALTAGRGKALVEALRATRAAWLGAAEKGTPTEPQAARLDAFRYLIDILRDLAALEPSGLPDKLGAGYTALQLQPAWQLSGAALAEFASGLSDRLGGAVQLVADGDPPKAIEALAEIRKDRAVLLLAGRLARQAVARKPAGFAALLQVAAGVPSRDAWLGDLTPDLTTVCRYAEELPTVRRTGTRAQADSYRAFANDAAARVLESLPR